MTHRVVPDRAVAVVELTTGQATSAGYRVRVAEYEIGDVAGAALYADGYTGHAQMVVDEDRQVILGFANNRRSSPLRSVPIRPVLDAYLAADGIDLSSYLLDRIDQIVPPGVTINVADNMWEFGTTALDAASHRGKATSPSTCVAAARKHREYSERAVVLRPQPATRGPA